MELLRSLIFVPGNRANMLERARSFNADIIMVDLEDSVPLAEKVNARELAREWVPRLRNEGKRVMVRVNSLNTGLPRDELDAVISPALNGISIGKAGSAWDLQQVDRIIGPLESAAGLEPGSIKIIPWIESARAIMNVQQMAVASPRHHRNCLWRRGLHQRHGGAAYRQRPGSPLSPGYGSHSGPGGWRGFSG